MQAHVFHENRASHLKVVNNTNNWNLKTTKNVIQCSSENINYGLPKRCQFGGGSGRFQTIRGIPSKSFV